MKEFNEAYVPGDEHRKWAVLALTSNDARELAEMLVRAAEHSDRLRTGNKS